MATSLQQEWLDSLVLEPTPLVDQAVTMCEHHHDLTCNMYAGDGLRQRLPINYMGTGDDLLWTGGATMAEYSVSLHVNSTQCSL